MKRFVTSWTAAAVVGAMTVLGVAAEAADMAKAVTLADGARTQEGAKAEEGKWVLPDGSPTYNVQADGTVDWYSYSGFRRYHSECHVCHGPEGEGSTYAPALITSLKTMPYSDFLGIVASGRIRKEGTTEFVMPALGDNKNVMCYIDDIYVYLKARSDGVLARGRPGKRAEKPKQAIEYEKSCLGH